ncbi:MAG TPA: hypothetical protein VG722_05165 [Tepidisphaeraceae bacterium]|nr:hypothetical protein [Tepidisphaeraceae bacterium]
MSATQTLPPLPPIGQPESFYVKAVHDADREGDVHKREAYKVGQYVTLATDPHLSWEEKLKYFCHALKRHCVPPPLPEEAVWVFYRSLANLVKQYAGQEALRLASIEDDLYATRINMGQTRQQIENDAEAFFGHLVPAECPAWFNDEDYKQLKLLRDQWI